MKSLIIVESPSKEKTILSYLKERKGTWVTGASFGHIFDLPVGRLGVDPKTFEAEFVILKGKSSVLKKILETAKNSDRIILATDPDREGEAIAFHIAKKLQNKEIVRCKFREITKEGINRGLDSPEKINYALVSAQISRRIIDRLFGYSLSPFLWKRSKGKSAGRVQSVALKWICERDKQIEEFKQEEYFIVKANARFDGFEKEFIYSDKNREEIRFKSEREAKEKIEEIQKELKNNYFKITEKKEKKIKKNPPPPFTTSSLEIESSTRLGFNSKKTMQIAQSLYEGRSGQGGLITYMRTDSIRVSEKSKNQARAILSDEFGKELLGKRMSANSSKNSEDAHEAIRPTNPILRPEKANSFLSKDESKLYELIWKRFMASFLKEAEYLQIHYTGIIGNHFFYSSEKYLIDPGYLYIYGEKAEKIGNVLKPGDNSKIIKMNFEKKKTEPPSPFTEAEIIKKMQRTGVGRPSTYSSTLEILYLRKYINKVKKSIRSTELGREVNSILVSGFPNLIDESFTRNMEISLDKIAKGEIESFPVLKDFYISLRQEIKNSIKPVARETETCPLCQKGRLSLKTTRKGKSYKICSRFPECEYSSYTVK